MHPEIARAWSVLLLRGVCNVLFALLAFLKPGLTLVALVLLWGIYAVVDGAMALTTGIAARRSHGHSWSLLLAGACGMVAGTVACIWPGVTIGVLLAIMSVWAIARGTLEIIAAVLLRHLLPRAWLLALAGVGSVFFGVLLIARPVAAVLTVVYLAGTAALLFGTLAIALALQLRLLSPEQHSGTAGLHP